MCIEVLVRAEAHRRQKVAEGNLSLVVMAIKGNTAQCLAL